MSAAGRPANPASEPERRPGAAATIKVLLAGDVMTGRGIDQILAHPSPPVLYEDHVKSALGYVELAEQVSGRISRAVAPDYIWGDALALLADAAPDVRIINLETAVTRAGRPAPKGINYRMHPDNIDCLVAAGIDCCVLANNHVLDWGTQGLLETLETLRTAGIGTAGAGEGLATARAPAVLPVEGRGRVLVHAFACPSSGVPPTWAATDGRAGVNFVDEDDPSSLDAAAGHMPRKSRAGDILVCSVHWGPNWGYHIEERQRLFARLLVDAGADVVFGHSSHHPKAMEVHRNRLILHGCGDFLNDYEGIRSQWNYRSDLSLAYLPEIDVASGELVRLEMLPFRIRRFQLRTAGAAERQWLAEELDRECGRFGLGIEQGGDEKLVLRRQASGPHPS